MCIRDSCPTVEYSEAVEGENVIEYAEKLKRIMPVSVNIEFLHGRMKPAEKNEIMDRFANNQIQILVSTTVVEVGVNVPNATVMMVENAERFGPVSYTHLIIMKLNLSF